MSAHGDTEPPSGLRTSFGDIDVYWFDHLLKSGAPANSRILDAGCGRGRNLEFLLRSGYINLYGCDPDAACIASVQALAQELSPAISRTNFRQESIEYMSFDENSIDHVLCNAVLHFATDIGAFDAMVDRIWKVLAPGGIFFARLASTIGIASQLRPLDKPRWFRMPDGTDRFLVDLDLLKTSTQRIGGRLVEPIKTVLVTDQRSMTNWKVQKM